jgi:hypothetical protein
MVRVPAILIRCKKCKKGTGAKRSPTPFRSANSDVFQITIACLTGKSNSTTTEKKYQRLDEKKTKKETGTIKYLNRIETIKGYTGLKEKEILSIL